MKKNWTHFIVGFAMLLMAVYELMLPDYWEFSMYFTAGLAFIVVGIQRNKMWEAYRKWWSVLSWILIILAGFLLLFLARTDV